jgi:putative DNA primase/helicase
MKASGPPAKRAQPPRKPAQRRARNALTLEIGSDDEIAKKVVAQLKVDFGEVPYVGGEFWRFNGKHWEAIPHSEILEAIRRWDGVWYGTAQYARVRLRNSTFKSIEALMAGRCEQPDFFTNVPIGINCENGFIAFDQKKKHMLKLKPHAKAQRQRDMLRGKWDGGELPFDQMPKRSLLRKLLDGSTRDDVEQSEKIALMGEIAGCAALGYATRLANSNCIVLHGEGANNGKGQLLDLLRGLLPESAVSAVSPVKFHDERYVAELASKKLNTSDELGTARTISDDMFKSIVTGDPITARKNYGHPFTFRPEALHVFACNKLPNISGGFDAGVFRRLLVVEFERVIPPEGRVAGIGRKIVERELPVLLAWAIDGARRLLRNGRFTEPRSAQRSLRGWQREANPVLGWLEERVERGGAPTGGPVPEMTTQEAYADFAAWYAAEGYEPRDMPTVAAFTQEVKAHEQEYGFRYKQRNSKRKFVGMALKVKSAGTEAMERLEQELEAS